MLEERWVEVLDHPNYAVSNYGRIVNVETDRELKGRPNKDGFLRVYLSTDGVHREAYIHHLVAEAFFGRFNRGEHIEHVNGNNQDNRADNLRHKRKAREYLERKFSRGRYWGKRVRIIETGEVFLNARACAEYIGGDYSHVYGCLRGERKAHLGYTFEYYSGREPL